VEDVTSANLDSKGIGKLASVLEKDAKALKTNLKTLSDGQDEASRKKAATALPNLVLELDAAENDLKSLRKAVIKAQDEKNKQDLADEKKQASEEKKQSAEEKKLADEKKKKIAEINGLTLQALLANDDEYAKEFRAFCKTSLVLEKLDFLTEVREKSNIKYIFENFVSANAPQEINLPEKMPKRSPPLLSREPTDDQRSPCSMRR
jgi:hypothetical protein